MKRKIDGQTPYQKKPPATPALVNRTVQRDGVRAVGPDVSSPPCISASSIDKAGASSSYEEEATQSLPDMAAAARIDGGQHMATSPPERCDTIDSCSSPTHPPDCRCTVMEVEVGGFCLTGTVRGNRWDSFDYPLLKSLLVNGFIDNARTNATVGSPSGSSSDQSTTVKHRQLSSEPTDKPLHELPWLVFRKLEAQEQATIQKIVRCFLRATRLECHRREAKAPVCGNIDNFVLHCRNVVLSQLEFACHLPEFRRKPPYVQVGLIKAACTSYLLLRLVQAYDVMLHSWRDDSGTVFGPSDVTRLFPSTSQEFWCRIASLAASIKTLLCSRFRDGIRRPDDGCEDIGGLSSFSLLHIVVLMSPEHVPYRRQCDRDIAADVSDCQQAYILLLRHHLEASHSVPKASWMLPALLESMAAIKRHSSAVRSALLSLDPVRSDPVLSDALSLVGLPVNSRRSRRTR